MKLSTKLTNFKLIKRERTDTRETDRNPEVLFLVCQLSKFEMHAGKRISDRDNKQKKVQSVGATFLTRSICCLRLLSAFEARQNCCLPSVKMLLIFSAERETKLCSIVYIGEK